MRKYKVPFSGFVYVEADSPGDARGCAVDGDTVYEETEFGEPEEIDDFFVEIDSADIV